MNTQKVAEEKSRFLKAAYDKAFSDESLCKEQLETVQWLEGTDNDEGQEW